MRSRAFLRTSFLIVVGVLCALPGCTADISANSAQGAAAPTLVFDLDGRPFDLWKTASPATVVVFTRTDCPVSNRFAPEIRRLYQTYHAKGVEFYLVYVDPDEKSAAIRSHLREYSYPCLGLRDPNHALVALCKATITPEAAVFDVHQKVTYLGRINDFYEDLGNARTAATTRDLADAIDATLAGRPVTTPRTRAVGCTIADLKQH